MIMSRPGDDNRVSNSHGVFTPDDGQPSTARRRIANSSVRRRRFNVNERAALQERRPSDTVVACGPRRVTNVSETGSAEAPELLETTH